MDRYLEPAPSGNAHQPGRREKDERVAGAAGIVVALLLTVTVLWLSGLAAAVPGGEALAMLLFSGALGVTLLYAARLHRSRVDGRGRV